MARITDNELLLVSKASQETLTNYAQGAQLARRSRVAIKQLQMRVARDRLKLAGQLLKDAIEASKAEKVQSRTVVSRAYYAMYHAARAATYISYGGDDHEQHSILPTKMPADFPNVAEWKNKLKNARLERNRADYDPYPQNDAQFDAIASPMIQQAKELILAARQYIKSKA